MKSLKEVGGFEITKYSFDMVDNEPKIVISMIKVLDQNGKYIKFAKLKEVEKYLGNYPVTFKKLEECKHEWEEDWNSNDPCDEKYFDGPAVKICVKCNEVDYDFSKFENTEL